MIFGAPCPEKGFEAEKVSEEVEVRIYGEVGLA